MRLLLHAITSPPDGPTPRGFRGGDLLARPAGELTVWATPLFEDHPPFTKEDVLEDHRLVDEIFGLVRACLPVRFPTEIEDVGALDLAQFAPRLERVRDACELAVTATWRPPFQESTPPVTADTPGRRYLQQRQTAVHLRDRAEHLADDVLARVGDSLLEDSRIVCPSEKIALSLALLVRRADAEFVKSRIPRHAHDVRILINGPWPPYTFADVRLEHTHGSRTGGAQA